VNYVLIHMYRVVAYVLLRKKDAKFRYMLTKRQRLRFGLASMYNVAGVFAVYRCTMLNFMYIKTFLLFIVGKTRKNMGKRKFLELKTNKFWYKML
jgi:hypothetical protein